ncbi:MFS transporter [Nocardia africana]|uniref:MFS transporter n=1 Tax=Nocardia africana TaxID=134964 RepID=A0ABW6NCJ2_9NOCA
MTVNLAAAALMTAQAVIRATGYAQVWHLWVFAVGLGVISAVETPTRMAFVSEIVGDGSFRDASAMSAMYFSVAQLVGPALAGVLIAAAGPDTALAVNAASYLATVAGRLLMRPGEFVAVGGPREKLDTLRGERRIRAGAHLMRAIVLLAAVGFSHSTCG